jgi:hypothetical protein
MPIHSNPYKRFVSFNALLLYAQVMEQIEQYVLREQRYAYIGSSSLKHEIYHCFNCAISGCHENSTHFS